MTRTARRLGLVFASIVAGAACGKSHKAPATPLRADLGGAVAVGIAVTSSSSTLVKFDASKAASDVLSDYWQAQAVAVSTADLIVSGQGTVVTTSGVSVMCYLLAIPRNSPAGHVKCLATFQAGGLSDSWPDGVATRGREVFFSAFRTGSGNELWYWDGVSDQVERLLNPGSALAPYAASGVANVCFQEEGQLNQLLCGDPSVGSWSYASFPGVDPTGSPFYQFGPHLIGATNTFDLSTLTYVATTGGAAGIPLPSPPPNGIYRTPDGGLIGQVGATELVKLLPPNLDLPVATVGTSQWRELAYIAPYGYDRTTAGQIFRIDPVTLAVGTNDYLAGVHLLSISYLHAVAGDTLEVDGTGTNGQPATIYINVDTGAVVATPPAGPVYEQVYSLQ